MDLRASFGFHQTPFTREIRVQDRLRLTLFDEALDALFHTVEQRMSAALIAPAGTGKTALLRALVARLPEARYAVHYVKVSNFSRKDMCREIGTAVGVDPAGNLPALMRRLQERFVDATDTDGLRQVLLLDDAHELHREVLGIIRVITNYDMDSRLVLSVLLAGQSGLAQNLQRPELEDVARRLAHCATLRPLGRDEMLKYVEHRCSVAGAKSFPYEPAAIDALYELGRGNLRATDALALKALEVACRAKARVVDANHVVEARKALWP
jgi:general secretion pathway protein A